MGRTAAYLDMTSGVALRNPDPRARLADQMFLAFEQACDLDEVDIARGLLAVVECFLGAEDEPLEGDGQAYADRLIQAHFRLLEMRYHYSAAT